MYNCNLQVQVPVSPHTGCGTKGKLHPCSRSLLPQLQNGDDSVYVRVNAVLMGMTVSTSELMQWEN